MVGVVWTVSHLYVDAGAVVAVQRAWSEGGWHREGGQTLNPWSDQRAAAWFAQRASGARDSWQRYGESCRGDVSGDKGVDPRAAGVAVTASFEFSRAPSSSKVSVGAIGVAPIVELMHAMWNHDGRCRTFQVIASNRQYGRLGKLPYLLAQTAPAVYESGSDGDSFGSVCRRVDVAAIRAYRQGLWDANDAELAMRSGADVVLNDLSGLGSFGKSARLWGVWPYHYAKLSVVTQTGWRRGALGESMRFTVRWRSGTEASESLLVAHDLDGLYLSAIDGLTRNVPVVPLDLLDRCASLSRLLRLELPGG